MVYALLATSYNHKTFYRLLGFGLLGQLLNVDLGTQTTVGSRVLGCGQLLKSPEVLVGESVGADGAEGSRGPGAGSEEL